MKRYSGRWVFAAALFLAIGFGFASSAGAQDMAPPMPDEELPAGSQVLTSGPVHEAFAEPVTLDAQAGVLVPRQPPASVREAPPAERPAAPGVVWIPGYWAWDQARADFIWVSGCWRVPPPGMYWVPGYWATVPGGWEWVAGFWAQASTNEQELQYLPAPPPAFETAPVGAAINAEAIWTPGCWYWQNDRYVMRHGYWLAPHPGWLWVPANYVWTPRGYVFCAAHWDYDMDHRGVLFAPVWFPAQGLTIRAGFAFAPSICVDLGILRINLFASPRSSHYYFGDYYDPAYAALGIYPRFDCDRLRTWYDPIFVYDRWHDGRTDPRWLEDEHRRFDDRRANPALRPPKTFVEMEARIAAAPRAEHAGLRTVETLKTFIGRKETPLKFETVPMPERRKIAAEAPTAVHQFRDERKGWEAPKPTAPVRPITPAARPGPLQPQPTETRPVHETRPVPTAPTATRPTHETQPVPPAPAVTRPHNTAVSIPPTPTPTQPTLGEVRPLHESRAVPPAPVETKPFPTTPAHETTVRTPTPAPTHAPAPTPAPTPAPAHEHTGPFVPAHDVPATQPEKVKLPSAPPIINRPTPPAVDRPTPPSISRPAPSTVTPSPSPAPTRTQPGTQPDRGGRNGPGTDSKDNSDGQDGGGKHH